MRKEKHKGWYKWKLTYTLAHWFIITLVHWFIQPIRWIIDLLGLHIPWVADLLGLPIRIVAALSSAHIHWVADLIQASLHKEHGPSVFFQLFSLYYYLNKYPGITHLWPHGVGINLAHVGPPVLFLHPPDVKEPGVPVALRHVHPGVVGDHVVVDGLDRLRVGLHPPHLGAQRRTKVFTYSTWGRGGGLRPSPTPPGDATGDYRRTNGGTIGAGGVANGW